MVKSFKTCKFPLSPTFLIPASDSCSQPDPLPLRPSSRTCSFVYKLCTGDFSNSFPVIRVSSAAPLPTQDWAPTEPWDSRSSALWLERIWETQITYYSTAPGCHGQALESAQSWLQATWPTSVFSVIQREQSFLQGAVVISKKGVDTCKALSN